MASSDWMTALARAQSSWPTVAASAVTSAQLGGDIGKPLRKSVLTDNERAEEVGQFTLVDLIEARKGMLQRRVGFEALKEAFQDRYFAL
jgi:hypothetical protein